MVAAKVSWGYTQIRTKKSKQASAKFLVLSASVARHTSAMTNTDAEEFSMSHHREELPTDLYAPTFDEELMPSLGIAIAGILAAYLLVWLLSLPFVPVA